MDPEVRVCPFCGEPPGPGVFCERCGQNLSAVERLPSRAEWSQGSAAAEPAAAERADLPRVASVDAFLAAMHAAGDPGLVEVTESKPGFLGRARHVAGWVVRTVERDRDDPTLAYRRGVFLGADGRLHQLESTTRGWGQRDAPHYVDLVGPELEPSDVDTNAVLADLAALLTAHGIPSGA